MTKQTTGYASIDKPWLSYYKENETDIQVPDMSLIDYLRMKNAERTELIAINYFGKKITYQELFERIDTAGSSFQQLGIQEGDYVALAMPLTPEVIVMIYALDTIGAHADLIDPRVPAERMKHYLNLVDTRMAIVISAYAQTMMAAVAETKVQELMILTPFECLDQKEISALAKTRKSGRRQFLSSTVKYMRDITAFRSARVKNKQGRIIPVMTYKEFLRKSTGEIIKAKYKSGRTSILEYTSGTTGIPKGVLLTCSGMNVTAEQMGIINKATPGDSLLAIMPPFISYGAVTGIHTFLAIGNELILIPKFSSELLPELIKTWHPNNIICVPSMFRHVIESPLFIDEDLSYFKRLIFGGDRTPPDFEVEVNEWLRAHNASITLIKGGGMAEFSSCAFETPFEETKKPGIYGIPLPLVDAKIMKDDRTECKYGEIGELYISSPQQMDGYVNNLDETENFFYTDTDGKRWGRSGDLGYVNPDGTFVLVSRKKQMIVRPDGHNVFPIEIEQAIKETGYVKDCAVIGVKDPHSVVGEYPFAFIELKSGHLEQKDAVLQKIIHHVGQTVPPRDRPDDDGYYLTRIIYTQEGKLDRKALLKTISEDADYRVKIKEMK